MIGQVHQTNEAWEDAIAAYSRVIAEFPAGNWVKDSKWSIAECIINLSQWRQAMEKYQAYLGDYPGDGRAEEAKRRVSVLKDLARYQTLVDEEGQRKAFDAQYQIAKIVLEQLSNRVKAVIEYRKVVETWGKSHLADDALHAVGTTYLAMGETDKAREAARAVAKQYPGSPLADDALFMVGNSFEDEANKFAAATRAQTLEQAEEQAQRLAYRNVQAVRGRQTGEQDRIIASLKKGGQDAKAELAEAKAATVKQMTFASNVAVATGGGIRQFVEMLTAAQLADRQDKINAALRKAVKAYTQASRLPGGDKAGDALLKMATIYDQQLKDSSAALSTWLEIVRQFSGTAVAENASWRIAQYYEREGEYAKAIEAYRAFLRNYRRSPKASNAQFAIAENSEHLGQWIDAMDAYTNYINNFPKGPMVTKAREQINWIKAYRL
jgi:TolA-binding protein